MRRVAIFAHYDPDDAIKSYILYHLTALREVCGEIHFVSTSRLAEKDLTKLKGVVTSCTLCENAGYDFGMWAQALRTLDLREWDEVVLANSSVFGPLAPLADSFERMRGIDCDFWGMSDSLEIEHHIQSFFLVFRSAILKSGQVERFFASVLPYRHKWQVIRSYELGLTHFLMDQGFVPAVVASVNDPRLHLGVCNPCMRAPMELIELGVPYVKALLFRENPYHLRLAPVRARMMSLGYRVDLGELARHPQEGTFLELLNRCRLRVHRWLFPERPALPLRPLLSAPSRAGTGTTTSDARQAPSDGPATEGQ